MDEKNKWLAWYVASSWLVNLGHGMIVTVVGPTQPYLASNVKVNIGESYESFDRKRTLVALNLNFFPSIDTINLVWTFGFFGYTIGALLTGFVSFIKIIRTEFEVQHMPM